MLDFAERRAQMITKPPETVLFEVVYGSWAHGTNTPTSDVDWRGVFLLPDDDFLGLGRPTTTWEDKAQDRVFWELGHFCSLLLKGNPNIVGMLFAPADCLIKTSPIIGDLVTARSRFLSQSLRSAYMGWIHREAEDLGRQHTNDKIRSGKSFVSAKRLSHLPRLIWELDGALRHRHLDVRPSQGRREYIVDIKTGKIDLDQAFADIGNMILDLEHTDTLYGGNLPEAPRTEINQWLLETRRDHGGRR